MICKFFCKFFSAFAHFYKRPLAHRKGIVYNNHKSRGRVSGAPGLEVSPMGEEFGPNFVTIVAEDGTEIELEFIDALEYNDTVYRAFFPVEEEGDEDSDEAEYGLIIMKPEMVDGEEMLTPVEDEEYDEVYEKFMEQIFEDEED